ncbi:DUF2637 domain-containing protein [Streptosporangium roseum]|uniref:DUF2637 domain-containing protein n=1 Tax=Streptosporangium roseum (strain ATCC 12428 / DSM 43021 / JCM 3005 / KCTC 9067 / NCIMB 10171 / NRRL 2505 / NI 9100) TaxID=479432 RepID=D2B9G5_STRRD|nr:DUF2637 domain-containing protein [Streptosporangium roseum]ACZ83971.1 hypothetical protein Sros_0968 [Streptosporangium roseum DSM 43021]
MDVKSPAAADSISRPSPTVPPLAEPSRAAVALRRAGIAVTGVGVAALAAAACVLSFDDLRVLAIAGEADQRLAYLYPAAFDALLAIAMIGVLLLRGGRWPVRLQAGVVLTLLFAAAAAAEVTTATRATVDARQAAVVVAVAPWVMLLLALWLWLLLIKHAAARRAAADARPAGHGRDIVPFPDADLATAEHPARPGHPVHPVHHPVAEVVLDPQAAPPLESAPHHDLPAGVPVVGPTPAPETPEIGELPEPATVPGPAPEPYLEPVPAPEKPVRWGDLVRPRQGDLLVHPPRAAVREPEPESRVSERVETWDAGAEPPRERETEVGDRDADTQPLRAMPGGPSPDPAHGAEAADRAESATEATSGPHEASGPPEEGAEEEARNAPLREDLAEEAHPETHREDLTEASSGPREEGARIEVGEKDEKAAAPPSGRMRSTPTPPEE